MRVHSENTRLRPESLKNPAESVRIFGNCNSIKERRLYFVEDVLTSRGFRFIKICIWTDFLHHESGAASCRGGQGHPAQAPSGPDLLSWRWLDPERLWLKVWSSVESSAVWFCWLGPERTSTCVRAVQERDNPERKGYVWRDARQRVRGVDLSHCSGCMAAGCCLCVYMCLISLKAEVSPLAAQFTEQGCDTDTPN